MKKVISGATIVTMDPDRNIIKDAAIVINDEIIEWLGASKNLPKKYQSIEPLYLPNHGIFPGFVNIHTHAALSILRGIGDDQGIAPAYSPNVPQGVFMSPEDCYIFSLLGALEALRFGTTCMVDNYIYANETARAYSALSMRGVVSERLHDADLFLIPEGRYEFDFDRGEVLLSKGIELFERWQGKDNGRIQVFIGPHAPDTCSTSYLETVRDAAGELDAKMVLHVAQSMREVRVIKERSEMTVPFYLKSLDLLGENMIAGHCIFITPDDIQVLAKTNTQVSHQSGSNSKGGMMAPIKAMVESGVNIGLGTDNMAGDMIEVMRLALCVARMQTGDPVALDAMDVLEMATINGARALNLDHQIGSIEIGKKADLVAINYLQPHLQPAKDPVANLVHNGLGGDVSHVFIDGKLCIENGKHTSFDTDELLAEVKKRSDHLWRKMQK
ncbi:MAG: amidohydrolase [Chloroflexota bacterium]|nr:amidohydrolase [Chloroflexota bacterium]